MANEVVKMYRNTGTDETPVWVRWYGEIIAEAVKIAGENGEPTAQNIKQYVDAKIAALIGSSTPETLDTLEEIATWIESHEDVAEALNQAITSKVPNTRKVNGKELSADITLAAEDVGAIPIAEKGAASGVASLGADGKVPSAQLPEGLPASGGNADTVNGHTVEADVPADAKFTDTTYEAATASALGLVKSGGDVTVNEDGTMSVNDDSHNHTIDNVDGLQDALDGKVPASRKVNGKALSADVTLAAADVGAIPATQKGVSGGVAELDSTGKVPSSQLPSYVDDVIEGYLDAGKFYNEEGHTTEIEGESGKIYVDLASGKTYRWTGTTYTVISETIALGETSSTAYRGDRGKAAYEHSLAPHAPSNAAPNVQADYNETNPESDAFIKNKPESFPASMITEDTTHRFVSDDEKTAWNNKADIIFASDLPETAPEGAICFLIEE